MAEKQVAPEQPARPAQRKPDPAAPQPAGPSAMPAVHGARPPRERLTPAQMLTVQRRLGNRAAMRLMGDPAPVHLYSPIGLIQRHSAYEHYLLGQVEPGRLSDIAMVREGPIWQAEIQRLIKEKELTKDPDRTRAIVQRLLTIQQKRDEVKHTIVQEMTRLEKWMNNKDAVKPTDVAVGRVTKGKDDKWQVPYVVIPVANGEQVVVTYSEMNTMPDLFGNPESMSNTPKAQVQALVQGVRQQSYIELDNLHNELFGESISKLTRIGVDEDFQGAQGPRAQAVVDKVYEIRTESEVNTATTRSGQETQQYFAALERNACHFAPESWNQWQAYHTKARALAQEAADARKAAADIRQRGGNESTAKVYDQLAAAKGNDALIQNSFGEHYLQDSFAAGHLIDKTKIMQWFVNWLNANDDGLGTFANAVAEWNMVSRVGKESLTSNPQMLDDKMMRGQIKSFSGASQEIGMEIDPEIVFMMWWRNAAFANGDLQELTAAQAAEKCPLAEVAGKPKVAAYLMKRLAAQKFAEATAASEGFLGLGAHDAYWTLDDTQIDVLKGEGPYKSRLAEEAQVKGTGHDYRKEAAEFNVASYNAFLHNAYVQAATKFFHDKYCKEGLDVSNDKDGPLFRIYGDNNMLKAGAAAGVKYSAETSQMSREAIFNLIEGTPQAAAKTSDIRARFPQYASEKGGPRMSLVNWNLNLKARGDAGLFKQAKDNGAWAVYKAKTGISDKGALNLELLDKAVKKEVQVEQHGGDF